MIFFLNRGLILEHEVVKALKKYFSIIRVPEYYKNFTVSITNQHPFARMILSDAPEKDAASLFPVVIVATEDDSKPAELANLVDAGSVSIELEDIKEADGGSAVERRYDMITPEIMAELRKCMAKRDDKHIYGASLFIRRRDHISIEIWAENPQLKNELYEIIRLFICGFLRDYLAELYKQYFGELEGGQSPLVIFDTSVRGQRSNNFNVEFGIELHGAHITFDADYIIEQTVIDTDIVDTENLLLEVLNHVKGYENITRERVSIGESGDPDGAGGESGAGKPNEPGEPGEPEPTPEAETSGGE